MATILAAADIGSNTAHLLVAETEGRELLRLKNDSDWLSLGEVVGREGFIPPPLEDRLVMRLKVFKATAAAQKAEGIYVFATEAMRIAENHEAVLARIFDETGIQVDLISPQREAELSYRGSQIDSEGQSPSVLVEVGGGSVQVARCERRGVTKEFSLSIGTGKLIAQTGLTQPAKPAQLAGIYQRTSKAVQQCGAIGDTRRLIASGGVARGLWRALHPDGEPMLHINELRYMEWAAAGLRLETLSARFGVKLKRAATLVPGAIIFRSLMEALGHEEMTVSQYGVREGAILEAYEGSIELCPV